MGLAVEADARGNLLTPDPRPLRAHRAALRAPRHGRGARRDRARGRRRRLGERARHDPRRRQQGGGRRLPRGRAARERRGLAGRRSSCCSRSRRRTRSRGAKAFDAVRAAGRLRLRASTTRRRSARSSSPRPTYYRLTAEFHGRAAHAGIRPEDGRSAMLAAAQRDRARCRTAASTSRRPRTSARSSGGVGSTNVVPERCCAAGRGALARPRPRRGGRRADDRRRPRRRRRRRVRRRRRLREALRRLPPEGHARPRSRPPRPRCARAATSRAGSSPAAARTPTRWVQGIECVNLANGTERNHEPTERVSVAALEGMLDVCLALLDEAAALSSCPGHELPLRAPGGAHRVRGRDRRRPRGRVPPRGRGGRSRASGSRTPARSAIVAHDGERVWLVRQPREATGEPDLLELPAGKLDEEGESPLECGAARARRGDRQGRRALGAPDDVLHLGGLHRRAVPHLPRDRPAATSPGTRSRTSGSTSSRTRSPSSTRRSPTAATRRRSSACCCCATACAVAERRVAPGRAAAAARRTPAARGHRDAARRAPSRSSTCCSTSSPTWSSSAGCRATRSRPTAPTCSSSASGSGRTGHDPLAVGHAELSAFADEIAAGREDKPPAAPATLQRKIACLRSFYRHLRRTARARRTTRPPTCARPSRAASCRRCSAATRSPSCCASRAGPSPPRCATARCWRRCTPAGCARRRRSGSRSATSTSRPACCAPAARAPRSGSCRSAPRPRARSRAYLQRGRPRLVGDRWEARLFVNQRGGGLTRQGLYKIVQRHAAERRPRGRR